MKFLVDQISDKPVKFHIEETLERFPVLAEMSATGECVFTGPIQGDLSIVREYDHLRVAGLLTAAVTQTCSRCLIEYDAVVKADFTIIFRKGSPHEAADEDEIELGEMDLISSVYSGDEIDLTHELEEQLAMEIPLKPLCSESCKGLCPSCGADLNQAACSCDTTPINLKFSALKDFKVAK